MRMIRFREKHDDRIFVFSTGREKQLILAQVAQERLDAGYWYDDENGSEQADLLKPNAHLSDAERIGQLLQKLFDPSKREGEHETTGKYLDQIQRWMAGRREYEYEDWDEMPIETCELTIREGSVRRRSQSD